MNLILVASWALAADAVSPADSKQVVVDYVVSFDLDGRADQVCGITGLCDCKATYAGTGSLKTRDGQKLTFEGTWKAVENPCHEILALWAPGDGKAFHTVTFGTGWGKVHEWVTHARAADTERFTSGIKQKGQYWIAPMQAAIEAGRATHTEDEESSVGGMTIKTRHELTLRFEGPAAAE